MDTYACLLLITSLLSSQNSNDNLFSSWSDHQPPQLRFLGHHHSKLKLTLIFPGAYGTVYKARDTLSDTIVAIKKVTFFIRNRISQFWIIVSSCWTTFTVTESGNNLDLLSRWSLPWLRMGCPCLSFARSPSSNNLAKPTTLTLSGA